MLLTKMLMLFVLCAAPEVGRAEAPVVSDVVEKPFVTIRYSAVLLSVETRSELADMVDVSFNVDVKFQSVGGEDILEVVSVSDSDKVDLKKVTELVEWYMAWDHCDD